MIEQLVPDDLWQRAVELLPEPTSRLRPLGQRVVQDRAALAGIVFVLQTGIPWNQLPTSLVGCSGVTCWRRFREWTEAGIWSGLYQILAAHIDPTRKGIAVEGGVATALSP